ncbi:MAG TPA: RlmE family RNA methyltransferase [Sediminispirochaeta sp.]|nr:RlmE family RNA methyltransferase [Sediminispirochaeta sp.]
MGMDRRKPDHYTQKAKKAGYPARSVYKLEEIQTKYRLLRPKQRVLDIGAAPGSWSMYAAEQVSPQGSVVAVDLQDCRIPDSYRQITILKGDAFSPELTEAIKARGPYNVVLSDAAPATTGNRTIDSTASAALAEQCLLLAPSILRPPGALVIKIFQGGEEQELIRRLRQIFKSVKPFKPKSSRKNSFEIFLIATGLKSEAVRSDREKEESL